MTFAYLAALVIALTGMVMLDRKFRLFFWRDSRRAAIVLGVGVIFFLAWDLAGVGLGIFFRGVTPFMTGWQIAREIPIEEVFFLALLCYLTMNLYSALELGGKANSHLRRDARGRLSRRSRGGAS
jgi:lycopene cyclase domain-containing protein